MRIVHFSTNDIRGGAARAAFRLHTGLRRMGHTSSMVVSEHLSQDPDVATFEAPTGIVGLVRRRIRQMRSRSTIARYRATRPAGFDMFSSDLRCLYGAEILKKLPPCDVINLHWISLFINVESFLPAVPRNVPIFWKLDDMNPFTGGCHFDHDCGKHQSGCGDCPQLGSQQQADLSNQVWRRKQNYFGRLDADRLHFIALNSWMAAKVKSSPLLGKFEVSIVPNGLDTDIFAPRDRSQARHTLGIPQDARVVFFAAESLDNKRKGFELLVEAVAGLQSVERLFLLSVGASMPPIDADIPHLNLGYLGDELQMALAYSAADLYVISSLQDNQPNTVVEAMACGIPVVGFDVGGVPELVRHGTTGLLAKGGDVQGLRGAIAELLQCDGKREAMKAVCRQIAVEQYSLDMQCRNYATLYDRALNAKR